MFDELRKMIAEHGFTQEEFAVKLGITRGSLHNKLSGRSFFNVKELKIICLLLDLPPDIFLSWLSTI